MNPVDKITYKIWKSLWKRLLHRGVIDRNGYRLSSLKLDKPWEGNRQFYNMLVAVNGFGYSGSSSIADILSEFEDFTVLCNVNENGSVRDRKMKCLECDFLRTAFGVFDLETVFTTDSDPIRDSFVKLFMHMINSMYRYSDTFYNDEFARLAGKFIDDITSFRIETPDAFVLNTHLNSFSRDISEAQELLFGNHRKPCIYFPKELTVPEYRTIASRFIRGFLRTIPSKRYMVLDQVLSDGSCDLDKYEAYVGPYKMISVYRDPRDVFAQAKCLNYHWVASNPSDFVLWYVRQVKNYLAKRDPRHLVLRFEDIVRNTDAVIARIAKFLGIETSAHSRPGTGFSPERSAKNIGLWKKCPDKDSIETIHRLLPQWCWED